MRASVLLNKLVRACLMFIIMGGLLAAPDRSISAKPLLIDFNSCDDVTAQIPKTECEALVALYTSTNGASWTNKTDWLVTTTPCSWYGVSCNAGHVEGLNLSSNHLTGPIPAELGNLPQLNDLFLYSNALSGTIPAQLGSLTNLTTLFLNSNTLSGAIPAQLGGLQSLTQMNLASNQLSWYIPAELGDLTDLTFLSLGSNQLIGSIPFEFGDLINLTHLSLSGNQLDGSIPPEMGDMTALSHLALNTNQLTGGIPAQLGQLENLTYLLLYSNQLSGAIPSELGTLTNLTYLNLGYNQLTGPIPAALGNLTNLTDLYLSSNALSGNIPAALGGLTKLKNLRAGENQLTGSIPAALDSLPVLEVLDLNSNLLSGSIPSMLGDLATLKELNLYQNEFSGAIPPELGSLTNLTFLDLSDNQLTGSIPTQLGSLTQLQYLYLWENQLSGSIPAEMGNLTQLTGLGMEANLLSGEIPTTFTNLVKLTYFVFDHCAGLGSTNASVITFLNNFDTSWNTCAPYIISGDAGLASAVLSYTDGSPKTANADANGDYSITVPYFWSGTVTPSKTGFAFSPVNKSYTQILENKNGQNYTAAAITYTISGNAGVAGAAITYTGGSTTANASGNYSFTVPYNWTGTVTPSKAGFTFLPVNRNYSQVLANQTAQNYNTVTNITVSSTAAQDGWVLESSESSKKGGTLDSAANTLRLGDDKAKKQYRSILSFDTGATLPDNAVITKVTLKVKKQGITGGGDPVTAFQGFLADIKKGFLGTTALQTTDFQTTATKTVGPFVTALNSGWYSIDLTGGKASINKLSTLSGLTQVRLRFNLDDNNNAVANYLSLYSGNAPAASRPQLIIQYYLP